MRLFQTVLLRPGGLGKSLRAALAAHKLLCSASYAQMGKGSQTQEHTTAKIR